MSRSQAADLRVAIVVGLFAPSEQWLMQCSASVELRHTARLALGFMDRHEAVLSGLCVWTDKSVFHRKYWQIRLLVFSRCLFAKERTLWIAEIKLHAYFFREMSMFSNLHISIPCQRFLICHWHFWNVNSNAECTDSASLPASLRLMVKRYFLSTSVAMWELCESETRSPSQCSRDLRLLIFDHCCAYDADYGALACYDVNNVCFTRFIKCTYVNQYVSKTVALIIWIYTCFT